VNETSIQAAIMIAVQQAYPAAVVFRRNVGKARDPSGRVIRFGLPGQADIGAIIDGRPVEIEVKTASGRQSQEQRNWQAAVERAGGIYILARSPDDALTQLGEQLGPR
jgi:hypothetical protein